MDINIKGRDEGERMVGGRGQQESMIRGHLRHV
jgi:hypothetical protein